MQLAVPCRWELSGKHLSLPPQVFFSLEVGLFLGAPGLLGTSGEHRRRVVQETFTDRDFPVVSVATEL